MLPQSTADHYAAGQRLTVVTVKAARRAWSAMGPDFDASWRVAGPRLTVLASAAQLNAARESVAYLPLVLAETGQVNDPTTEVLPRSLVGVAADGRSLDGLLYGSVTTAKSAVGNGANPTEALSQGGRWLDMAMQGVVADAARVAAGMGIAVRPHLGGYVRMLNGPSCSRCAILAGKFFKWNAGFQRHPRCDCRHIPASEDIAGDFRTDPQAAFKAGQITDLRPAEIKALGDGADISQVVNARRCSSGLRGLTTTEGTTRRGIAGARLITGNPDAFIAPRGGDTIQRAAFQRQMKDGSVRTARISQARTARLTPDGIYRQAGDDREGAISLLRAHGYVL